MVKLFKYSLICLVRIHATHTVQSKIVNMFDLIKAFKFDIEIEVFWKIFKNRKKNSNKDGAEPIHTQLII